MVIIYGRLVTKDEYAVLKDTQVLYPVEESELVPAFDATRVLDAFDEDFSRDKIKTLHKLLGGSGAADRICLFKTTEEPVVKDIQFRKSGQIKMLLGKTFKEVKFKAGTKIEIVGLI